MLAFQLAGIFFDVYGFTRIAVVVVVVGLKPLYRLPLCVTQFVLAL